MSCGATLHGAPGRGEGAFDFLIGEWRGDGSVGRLTAIEVLGGAAIEERWDEEDFSAIVLRSFDGERWHLTFVTPGAPPQVWEGRWEEARWRFYREWDLEGGTVLSRTWWEPRSEHSFVRVVEQSRDGGESWREHVRAVHRRLSEEPGEPAAGARDDDAPTGEDELGRAVDWKVGLWRGVRRDGGAGEGAPITLRVEPIFGGAGQVFHVEVIHGDAVYRGLGVDVPDRDGRRWIRHYTSAGRGSFAGLEGRFEGTRSVWTSASPQAARHSSQVSERLGPDGWRRTMSISEDSGATWKVLWVDELERVPPS